AAVIGIPLYIRVSTLLPLAGAFMDKGVSIGAIIALVIGSGGASIPEVIMLNRLFRWPLLAAFLGVIFTMAVVGGSVFNIFLG
ncbi:MAG: permease, partial [Halocynthiibacter sp.]